MSRASSAISSGRTRQQPADDACACRRPSRRRSGRPACLSDPRSACAVPLFAAVGVDDDGLSRRLARDLDRVLDVRGRAAIHAHRDDFRHIGRNRERLGQRLPRARRAFRRSCSTATPEHPTRRTRPTNASASSTSGTVSMRQHVGSRVGEDLQPRQVPVRQLRDRQAHSARRTPRRWPAPRRTARRTPPPSGRRRPASSRAAAASSTLRRISRSASSARDSARRETVEGRLVARRRRDRRTRRGRTRSEQRRSPRARRTAAAPTTGRRTGRGRALPVRWPGHHR